jgi:hypothetical protein
MGGSAILDPDVLVDSLVEDVIDGLREELHPPFGVRAYRVFTVLRTWSGVGVGEGEFTDTETEIRPQPLVVLSEFDRLRYELQPCGLTELGQLKLVEVSLTYTEAELTGGDSLADNEEWYIKITEAHGQESTSRYFTHVRPPFIDRIKDMGWICWLKRTKEPSMP